MFFRFRKRKPPTQPQSDATASEASTPEQGQTTDWVPESPPSTEEPGVTLGESKNSPLGTGIESARGSHR
jgi:hypothetical protein